MTDEEVLERLRAACERVRVLGRPGPRPVYDPGRPAVPMPTTDTKPPPPHQDADTDTEEGD